MSVLGHRDIVIFGVGLGLLPAGVAVIAIGGTLDSPTTQDVGGGVIIAGLLGIFCYAIGSILITEWRDR